MGCVGVEGFQPSGMENGTAHALPLHTHIAGQLEKRHAACRPSCAKGPAVETSCGCGPRPLEPSREPR